MFLVKTYTQKRQMEHAERPVLDAVSSWEIKDDSPGLISVDKFEVSVDNCDTAAIEEVGDEVVDTSVTFHPITNCSEDQCKQAYTAWLRAYHDVNIILQMIEHIDNQPSDDLRAAYWREPFADENGTKLPDTSLEYYFGEFEQDRFRVVRDAYRHLRKIMTYPEEFAVEWKFGCEPSTSGSCAAAGDVAAFHDPQGYVGLCSGRFFSETEGDSAQLERRASERVRLLVHESLHWIKVSWVNGAPKWIDDTHKHRHGEACDQVVQKVDDRKWCQVLHLATYPGPFPDGEAYCAGQIISDDQGCKGCGGSSAGDDCSHHDIATINNDTYGYATAEIGAGLRRQGAHHWPSAQYSASANDDCVDVVPNPLPTIDTCFYSIGSLDCADATIAVSNIGSMDIDCPP